MLRQAARQLLRQQQAAAAASNAVRAVGTSAPRMTEVQKNTEQYLEKFAEVAPAMLNPPNFPSDFLPKEEVDAEKAVGLPEKLSFNFYLPHDVLSQKEPVDLVLIPALTGDFGVMPGHVPTVAQLRPGVVTVHKTLDKEVEKFFVSSGFAFVHEDSSADVCAVEAVKVDDLDPEAVRAGLSEYNAKLAASQAKGDDYETAAAQIGVEVYSAMSNALGL